ncbi:glycosyltransferase [Parashewanella curva]|uniref:Glycosyltransferase n=1 Tax=Parashewanella curva TaxID=2338552 RepID=A0A3L8Q2X2_9GAMM|nr:glycosyltransferase [Parashewanella curva]RLV61408.1 glycosyltransferase [Parashewanella curva]
MRVLFVATGLGIGGAEKQILDLAEALIKKGHSVKVACITGDCAYPLSNEVQKSLCYLNANKSPISLLNALFKLSTIIRQFMPDAVHSHMVHANIFSRIVRLFTKTPVLISSAHNQNEGGKLRMLAYRVTNNLSDLTTNVSEQAALSFIEKKAVPKDQIKVFYNGINTDLFHYCKESRSSLRNELRISQDDQMLLAVGRLTEAKDYPNMLRAIKLLIEKNNKLKLFIAGQGELSDSLNTLVEELNLTENVTFLGVRHDINCLMSAADCFVLSSEWEGLPLVIGEAMACELPVVVTNAGGSREFVNDNGFVVPIQNADALAAGIQSVLDMPEQERKVLGNNARNYIVNHFSLDAVADKWIDLYRNLNFQNKN